MGGDSRLEVLGCVWMIRRVSSPTSLKKSKCARMFASLKRKVEGHSVQDSFRNSVLKCASLFEENKNHRPLGRAGVEIFLNLPGRRSSKCDPSKEYSLSKKFLGSPSTSWYPVQVSTVPPLFVVTSLLWSPSTVDIVSTHPGRRLETVVSMVVEVHRFVGRSSSSPSNRGRIR